MLIGVFKCIFMQKGVFRIASRENMLIDVVTRLFMLKGVFSCRDTRNVQIHVFIGTFTVLFCWHVTRN